MSSPIIQAGGTPGANTLQDTSIEVITQRAIAMLKAIAAAKNRQAIDGYKAQLAQTLQNNQTNASLGVAPFPLPPFPVLMKLNEQVVIDNEKGVGEKDWSHVYEFEEFHPLPPKPPAVHPVVINPNEDEDYPGFHAAASGDGGDIPIGAISPIQGDGHEYKKSKVGRSPFAPGGIISRWQQIS